MKYKKFKFCCKISTLHSEKHACVSRHACIPRDGQTMGFTTSESHKEGPNKTKLNRPIKAYATRNWQVTSPNTRHLIKNNPMFDFAY